MSSDIAAAVAPGQLELLDFAAIGRSNDHHSDKQHASPSRRHQRHGDPGPPAAAETAAGQADSGQNGSGSSKHASAEASRSATPRSPTNGRASPRTAGKPAALPRKDSDMALQKGKKVLEVALTAKTIGDVKQKVCARVHQRLYGSTPDDQVAKFDESVKEERVNVRRLWQDVQYPDNELGRTFSEQVDQLLLQQELDCLLPEDCLDRPTAKFDVFARWLFERLDKNYNSVLLLITKHKWLEDKPTSLLLKRLIAHNSADKSQEDEGLVAPDVATGNTPLHQLACLNYTESAHALFWSYPDLWRVENRLGELPLEVAIDNSCNSIAVKLIDDMPNDHVRDIFKKRRRFYDILNNGKMRDVSHAVLDRLSAEWPDEEGGERGYEFFYQALESDSKGRMPGDEGFNGQNSCFMNILKKKKLYQEFGNKRVVRMLLNTKWKSYGEKMMWFSALAFFATLFVLTYATEMAVASDDPRQYANVGDYFRAVAEVITLLILASMAIGEVLEMIESRNDCRGYWTDPYNITQIVSFSLLFAVVPLRYLDPHGRAQWIILSLGYFIMMTRAFKFISTSSLVGVYTRVIVGILARVMPKFFVVFAFILFAWSGAWYPALRSHDRGLSDLNTTETDIGLVLETSSYWENLFLGVRIMIEGRNLIDYYNNRQQLGGLSVFYYMAFLTFVTLIMRTILIAQMAATYNSLNRDAVRQLELNRSWVLPSLEQISVMNGKWSILGEWRRRYYIESEDISSKDLQTLLQEENVDGFVHLERLLHKQKAELVTEQRKLLEHIDHQTVLEEKWHNSVMASVKTTKVDLQEQVVASCDVVQDCGVIGKEHVTTCCNTLTTSLVASQQQQFEQVQTQLTSVMRECLRQESEEQRLQIAQLDGRVGEQTAQYGVLQSSLEKISGETSELARLHQAQDSSVARELTAVKTLVQQQSALLQQLSQSMASLQQQNVSLRADLSSLSRP